MIQFKPKIEQFDYKNNCISWHSRFRLFVVCIYQCQYWGIQRVFFNFYVLLAGYGIGINWHLVVKLTLQPLSEMSHVDRK